MNLYARDFSHLDPEEESQLRSLQAQEVLDETSQGLPVRESLWRDYPKAARHYSSLFPNNFLDPVELEEEERLKGQLSDFTRLLNSSGVSERDVLGFISERQAYFIIGAILKKYYTFGHHDAYLFPEFPLGISYRADYLLVGRSSDGWSFVFVELESPGDGAILQDGQLGHSFRKGLGQTEDWDNWIDRQFSSLKDVFDKSKRVGAALDDEFVDLDKSRIHYVVVAGRRTEFTEKAYRLRRKRHRDSAEVLAHYDNVIDAAEYVIGKSTY